MERRMIYQRMRFLQFQQHQKEDNRPSELLTHLYMGSIGAALNKRLLLDLGITHILVVSDQLRAPYSDIFQYKSVLIQDQSQSNLLGVLDQCISFIEEARSRGGKVLVHWQSILSFAGISRSAAVCIGYLMKMYSYPLLNAFDYVRQRRAVARPNSGFMNQLQTYEELINKVS